MKFGQHVSIVSVLTFRKPDQSEATSPPVKGQKAARCPKVKATKVRSRAPPSKMRKTRK
ncbi:hypothetical protein ANCCAN_28679 [Ancylostoma caninum]|uniref:Uncharacterized protein n=1 Tax=Ancylostoma caninum TaxID=29170 RepID=A0A368F5Z3_ANCCA|nr:hypothetical protein ANCCAN_28679 [Ancylostoma caninum]